MGKKGSGAFVCVLREFWRFCKDRIRRRPKNSRGDGDPQNGLRRDAGNNPERSAGRSERIDRAI